uniref:DDE Tnp4 domain-containing protein n=1 Tax=Lactuca sativa TaxID=4236 RepID=A0A9R1VA74_LACSA|nr:hypothetical protein LSAT_V11C600312120 [Lactuca sativa]
MAFDFLLCLDLVMEKESFSGILEPSYRIGCMIFYYPKYKSSRLRIWGITSHTDRYTILDSYAYESDTMCLSQLRMNRRCFARLCCMLETLGGLKATRYMNNRVLTWRFHCSGETISRLVTRVCHERPDAITEDSTDQRWKWFKNYLGALDGTHIKRLVPLEDKPRYRTRENDIATNVLEVCPQDMQFIYVLPGWEGSVTDSRVLRNTLLRPNGLKIRRPGYYLVDVGYTNREGFLSPYRGQTYHLNDWCDGHQTTTQKDLYNMRHCSARNVIERCFGILKAR